MISSSPTAKQPKLIPHQLTENVKFMHKIAIVWNGHVLMLKRNKNQIPRPEKWDLPGGNSEWPVDSDEPIHSPHIDDVTREIIEETGLIISPEVFNLNSLIHFESYFDPEKQVYSILCGWFVILDEKEAPEIQISNEHSDAVWVHKNELEQYDPGFATFIHQIARTALEA